MELVDQLRDYSALLEIRRKAYRRNMVFVGVLLFVLLIAFVVVGLLRNPGGNSSSLEAALLILLGMGFISTWVKHAVLTGNLELLTNLQRMVGQTSAEKMP
ncbi:MAG: hypothetical protein PHQ40_07880 [Anaerolineaceae bacterium]|nr:hypothetical protein [Anaerolineaceae bacterium]